MGNIAFREYSPHPDIVEKRYQVLKQIASKTQSISSWVILQACLQRLIPPEFLQYPLLNFEARWRFPFDALIQRLVDMGYQRRPLASDKGEFAVRGGIIDVFPVSSPILFDWNFGMMN